MTVVDVFLSEIFPPKKPGAGKTPPAAAAGGGTAALGKPFQAKKVASNNGDQGGDQDTLQPNNGQGADTGNSDALIAMQNAQKEKEQQEAQARAAKEAEESGEMAR